MRILSITHSYPRLRTPSAGIFAHRWHLGLRELGHDVQVVQLAEWAPPMPFAAMYAPWRENHIQRRDMLDSVEGIKLHHPRNFTARPSRFFPADSWVRQSDTIARYVRNHRELARADVILAHFMVPDGFHALSVGRALGLPVASVAWGDDVHAWPESWPYWRTRLTEVLRSIELPIACSQQMAIDANAWLEDPRQDWSVVYGGVDLDTHAPVRDKRPYRVAAFPKMEELLRPETKILLSVARPVRAKGYLELLDAWQNVIADAPEWRLVALGGLDGDLNIPQLIEERGLSSQVHWLGYRSGSALVDLIKASDAFVLASHNEGLSLSLLEAMAAGLPAVATDVGGHRELITSDQAGWLIPPRDTRALERALRELMSSDLRRMNVGTEARNSAERIGSPSTNAARLSEHLLNTVALHKEHRSSRAGRRQLSNVNAR